MMVKIIKPKNKGGALVLMTGIGVAMMILSLTIILLGGHGRLIAARTGQKVRARTAADAGMVDAIFKMNKKLIDEAVWDNSTLPSASISFAETPVSFNYSVSGLPSTSFTITSTGTSGITQENVYAILAVGSYWKGIGVKENVDIKLGTEFSTIPEGGDIQIRTNSIEANAMRFKAFVSIPGDVIYGHGGDEETVVDTKATTVIEGATYEAEEPLLFPPVSPPDPPLPYQGSINASGQITGDGQYDMIDIPQSGLLEVTAPSTIYITGNAVGVAMILGQDSQLVIKAGASLNLYLGGNLEDKNSMGLYNENPQADTFKIFGLPTCTQMDLKAKSDLYAAIYAPDAVINLFNSGTFTGAIVGNSFYMKNSGVFIYDTSLAYGFIDDPAAVFDLVRWWED
jgi:hypothetical protein